MIANISDAALDKEVVEIKVEHPNDGTSFDS